MLRKVDFKEKKFECGGRVFHLTDTLSFNRYRQLERLSIMFGFSTDFAQLFSSLQKMYDNMQTAKNYADVSVMLHNILIGVKALEGKDDPALQLCALFINEADEDVTVYDEVKMRDKIDCWAKELDVTPFFHLAASLVEGWLPAYRVILADIFKEVNKE